MIRSGVLTADDTVLGGGGGPPPVTINFSPAGGTYSGTSISVTITVTNAPNLRWKINAGSWTNVTGTSTNVSVPLSYGIHTLFADALDGSNNVLASWQDDYTRSGGG